MEGLAEAGRRTVSYDQLGDGNSDRPQDPSLYDVALFAEEVDVVHTGLGLDRIHLYGSSWGGMLAMEYALTHRAGLASLVLASAPASVPQWVEETAKLRASCRRMSRTRFGGTRTPKPPGPGVPAGCDGVLSTAR